MSRRDDILAAARRLLLRHGPSRTTVADIAHEASVGVGTVYLEFSSKGDIVAALSDAHHQRILSAMRDASSNAPPLIALRAALRARFEALVLVPRDGHCAAQLIHCLRTRAVCASHQRFCDAERALLRDLLSQGAADGALRAPDPDAIAQALLHALLAFSPPLVFKTPHEQLRPALETLLDLLVDGLRPR